MPLAFASGLAFGLTANFAPYAYAAGASVALFLAVRFALCFVIVSAGTGKFNPIAGTRRSEIPWLAAMSLCMGLQSMLYLLSIYHLSVSLAVCLFFLFPVFTYVLESILGKHPWSAGMIAGYVLAMLGTWALVGGGEGGEASLLGVAAGIGAALAQAFVNLVSVRTTSVGRLGLLRVGFILPLILAVALWVALDGKFDAPSVAWSSVAALFYLLGMFLYISALRRYGSVKASTYLYVEPILTIFLGMALHSESLTLVQAAGIALIAIAIALIEIKARKVPVQSLHA